MKHTSLLLLGFLVTGLLGTNAEATHEKTASYTFGSESVHTQTAVDAHMTAIATFQAQALDFEKRIRRHETRLAQLAKKPYLDPKGHYRFGSTMMLSHLRNQLKTIEQKIAWHDEQMRQLQA